MPGRDGPPQANVLRASGCTANASVGIGQSLAHRPRELDAVGQPVAGIEHQVAKLDPLGSPPSLRRSRTAGSISREM